MADPYAAQPSRLDDPFAHLAAVTPADGSDLPVAARGLLIGGDGNVKLTTVAGETVTVYGLPAGALLPVRVARVWSTGTTATNIVAGW